MSTRGKLAEMISSSCNFVSRQITAATIYFNGASLTDAGGYGIDTQGYEDVEYVLNYGDVLGAVCTVLCAVYENTVNAWKTSTLVTSASFTSVDTSNDAKPRKGAIYAKANKRWQWLRVETQGEPLTVDFGAVAILGRPDTQRTNEESELEFDL